MKKSYKIILGFIFILFSLSSCGQKEEKVENKEVNINNQLVAKIKDMGIKKEESGLRRGELKYDKDKEKLHIGANIEISPSTGDNLPSGITIYKGNKTYKNSNNSHYLFFVADKSDTVEMISDYYTKLLKSLGYKRIGEIPKEKSVFLENLEFQLGEEVTILEGDLTPKQLDELKNIEPVIKVNIKINSEVPNNIINGMGLNGTFVEIYYNTIIQ